MKVIVSENFTLKDFNKLTNIVRKDKDVYGKLFLGDTFECDDEMYNYLNGANKYQKSYVNLIEEDEPIVINKNTTILLDGSKVFDSIKEQQDVKNNIENKKKKKHNHSNK